MIHTNRKWKIVDVTRDELADWLTQYTLTACSGFRCDGHLWLNDSFSEDGAQEYAVVREATGAQVESVTVSWADSVADMLDLIDRAHRSELELGDGLGGRWRFDRDRNEHDEGVCRACA